MEILLRNRKEVANLKKIPLNSCHTTDTKWSLVKLTGKGARECKRSDAIGSGSGFNINWFILDMQRTSLLLHLGVIATPFGC